MFACNFTAPYSSTALQKQSGPHSRLSMPDQHATDCYDVGDACTWSTGNSAGVGAVRSQGAVCAGRAVSAGADRGRIAAVL